MLGFLRQRQIEKDEAIRENIIEYLIELLQDGLDFGWPAAKGAHHVLVHSIIDGLTSWADLDSVQKIRERFARTPNTQVEKSRQLKPAPCFKFNRRTGCHESREHVHQHLLLKHCCQLCFQTNGKWEDHPKFKCPRQATNHTNNYSKNV